jgi:hypothetical protein
MTRAAGLVLVQLRYEQKVFWRNIGVAFFTFASPVLLFVLFGALLGVKRRSGLRVVAGHGLGHGQADQGVGLAGLVAGGAEQVLTSENYRGQHDSVTWP